jgi:hypothetical protein
VTVARYLGALGTRLARIEAARTATHVRLVTETGRSVSLDAREILGALGDALQWAHDPIGDRPSSRALTVLAAVDPATQPSLLMSSAVRAAHAVVKGEQS